MSKPRPEMTPAEAQVDRLKTVAAIVVIVASVGVIVNGFSRRSHRQAELAASSRYTIGEIVKKTYVIGPSSHSATRFAYTVGDSTYVKPGPDEVPDGRTRFLVKFSTRHPEYYQFYERVPIPYTITEAPPEGWPEPPFSVAPEDME
ncbi:hypothetical protein [Hymenobacter terrenus]|uniref:hypothetical protein n=1 Tax=Hymenobacter terrenus TaxID=1629124 RepID=UPI000619C494|nr:hypothetical protein [Hymenobacter terrenus]